MRPADAVTVYRAELNRFPNNGWSLFDLSAALRETGQVAQAKRAKDRFSRLWADADVKLTSSCIGLPAK